jgi:hypothetical protein
MKHSIFSTILAISSLAFLLSGCCRTDCANTYIIEGVITESTTGLPCIGFDVELEEQVLENGVLNGFFETAGTTSTDDAGFYSIIFPRKNALEYRLNVSQEGWYDILIYIDPEDFYPDIPVQIDIESVPVGELDIHVFNDLPTNDSDKIRFRLLKNHEQYSTCDTEWKVLNGASIDTVFNCVLPGNTWMPYLYIDESNEDVIEVTDSVFCVAFEVTTLEILY